MLQQLKYAFVVKIRNFSIVFWPLLFPLALTTLMYFSVGQMDESDFDTIDTAVVYEEVQDRGNAENAVTAQKSGNDRFLQYLTAVEEDSDLIRVRQMEDEEAVKALEEKEVRGIYYIKGEDLSLTVSENSLSSSILESLLTGYEEGRQTLENVMKYHPEGLDEAVKMLGEYGTAVEYVSLGGNTTDTTAQFFYAMIGMACLYGCFIGFGCALWLQCNLTALAARRCVAPVHRLRVILTEFAAGFGIHFVNVMILLAYMKYILRLEFAGSYLSMVPVAFIGGMFGVAMGIFVGSIGKMGEGIKIGILIGVSMLLSFLAGLMNPQIKVWVDQSIPVLNRINPAAVISDALYCINVFDSPERLGQDMIILTAMCILMVAGAFLIVRRERYDSI